MLTSFILSIVCGQLRHVATTAGGALLSQSIHFVAGMPVVHDHITAASGALLVAFGAAGSAFNKVKTKSGADYKVND